MAGLLLQMERAVEQMLVPAMLPIDGFVVVPLLSERPQEEHQLFAVVLWKVSLRFLFLHFFLCFDSFKSEKVSTKNASSNYLGCSDHYEVCVSDKLSGHHVGSLEACRG